MKRQIQKRAMVFVATLFSMMSETHAEAPLGSPLIAALERNLPDPILLRCDDNTAFRDPLLFHDARTFYLYYSYVKTDEEGRIYWFVGMSKSTDLVNWTKPKILTDKDQHKNFCSPGSIIRFNNEWVLTVQSYPMPGYKRTDKLRFGNRTSRVWTMNSTDLVNWREPEIIEVFGPGVKLQHMIDPVIVKDKDEPGKWWCFYRWRGYGYSWSTDLEKWTPKKPRCQYSHPSDPHSPLPAGPLRRLDKKGIPLSWASMPSWIDS